MNEKGMHTDTYNLTRFTEVQNGVYPIALKELQEGANALIGCGISFHCSTIYATYTAN